jgi:phenylpropionate dioxygenase-like ring-hydroxylating dioxygenase large terminal subunit
MAWLDVLAVADVEVGDIVTVELGPMDVVVWRSAGGVIAACDARCPHQWSDLGSAGAVDGEELVCLSHHWRFDTDGRGTKLSAAGRRDEKGPVATIAVREADGRIEIEVPESDAPIDSDGS